MGKLAVRKGEPEKLLTCSLERYVPQLTAAEPFPEHEVEIPAAALALRSRAAVKGVDLAGIQPKGFASIVAEKQGAVQQHQMAVIVWKRSKGAPFILHYRRTDPP